MRPALKKAVGLWPIFDTSQCKRPLSQPLAALLQTCCDAAETGGVRGQVQIGRSVGGNATPHAPNAAARVPCASVRSRWPFACTRSSISRSPARSSMTGFRSRCRCPADSSRRRKKLHQLREQPVS